MDEEAPERDESKEFLVRCATSRKPRGQSTKAFLAGLTFLHLEGKGISSIERLELGCCSGLRVLFLNTNAIRSISGLGTLSGLTELYLQENKIERIEGLFALTGLRKLVLDFNQISVVDGLENNTQLTELHVSRQRLPHGVKLTFAEGTLAALGNSLEVLYCAGNRVEKPPSLPALSSLNLSFNELTDIDTVTAELKSCCPRLTKLDLEGNPITKNRRYREATVLALQSLRELIAIFHQLHFPGNATAHMHSNVKSSWTERKCLLENGSSLFTKQRMQGRHQLDARL